MCTTAQIPGRELDAGDTQHLLESDQRHRTVDADGRAAQEFIPARALGTGDVMILLFQLLDYCFIVLFLSRI